MPIQVLPEADEVRSVLHGLLGRDVNVLKVPSEGMGIDARVVVGLYERENSSVGGLVVADLEVAAFAGAALSLLPIGIAKETVQDGDIEGNILENFQEVLNVGVQWFTGKMNPRVVLSEVYTPSAHLPSDVATVMAHPAERADFEIDVVGYGGGRMRFLVTDY
jgi:hypothetical protein